MPLMSAVNRSKERVMKVFGSACNAHAVEARGIRVHKLVFYGPAAAQGVPRGYLQQRLLIFPREQVQ
jgi:hypothetical protein